jgi:hypothetical protein
MLNPCFLSCKASYDVAVKIWQALSVGPDAARAVGRHGLGRAHRGGGQGEAVQVDPIKPKLKAPGIMQLKLQRVEPPSKFALKINLRRYSKGDDADPL